MTARPDWDPGWKKAILAFRPWPGHTNGPDGLPLDPLTTDRRVFGTLVLAAVLLVVAFALIPPGEATVTWPFWVLGAYAVILHAVLIPVGQRMMTMASEEPRLILRYRTRFFIGVGECFTAEFFAIVCLLIGAPFITVVVGCAITVSGLWRIAPSQRVFRLCDERLRAQGKTIRMTEAWRHLLTDPMQPMPPPPTS